MFINYSIKQQKKSFLTYANVFQNGKYPGLSKSLDWFERIQAMNDVS